MTKKKRSGRAKTGKEVYNTLGRIINSEYENYADKLIFKIDDVYVVHNKYAIKQDTQTDTYQVVRLRDESSFTFNSKRMALLWSILDNNKYFYEANRIQILDKLLSGLAVERSIHDKLLKRDIVVYSNKIQQDNLRNKKYNGEINKYIRLVNKLQKRNFENEIN